jgi:hypothetical protein
MGALNVLPLDAPYAEVCSLDHASRVEQVGARQPLSLHPGYEDKLQAHHRALVCSGYKGALWLMVSYACLCGDVLQRGV